MHYPVKPVGATIIVKPVVETVSTGGIILPEDPNQWTGRGTVIAVGSGRVDKGERIPIQVAAGDEVLYVKDEATDLDVEDLVLVPETHILGSVNDDGFKPYWDKILVDMHRDAQTLSSGLILPGEMEHGYETGTVVAVGPGFIHARGEQLPETKEGDEVLFSMFDAAALELDASDTRKLFITRDAHVKALKV